MTDAEALQRFVRAAADLEPELARWVAAAVWKGLSLSRRRSIRDALLREAARRLPPVSAWQKAHEIAELMRRAGSRPGVSTAAGLVTLAEAVYRPERRDRQIGAAQVYRVVSRIRGGEKQVSAALDLGSMLDSFERE